MDGDFQVKYLLMSLPPSWENLSQTLSHQKRVTLSEVEARLLAKGQRLAAHGVTPTNFVIIVKTKNNNGALTISIKNKRKFKSNKKRKGPKNGVCFNCRKPGHFSSQCRKKRGESSQQGKVTKENGDFFKVVTKSMMVDTNNKNWWIDLGTTDTYQEPKLDLSNSKRETGRSEYLHEE